VIKKKMFYEHFPGLLLFSSFVFLGMTLNKPEPLEMNIFPNYVWHYSLQLILPNIVGFIVCTLFYINNGPLRAAIFSEIKNYISVIY
jgi:hypothetical protein